MVEPADRSWLDVQWRVREIGMGWMLPLKDIVCACSLIIIEKFAYLLAVAEPTIAVMRRHDRSDRPITDLCSVHLVKPESSEMRSRMRWRP